MIEPDALLSERFFDALHYAGQLHNHQVRKGAKAPYIAHLLAVASLVLEHGGSEDEAIAALLHDAIEDQAEHQGGAAALRAAIHARYGATVLWIVNGCTDAESVPKPPWRERKESYIRHVRDTPDPAYHRVSIADKLHNARSMLLDYRSLGDALWERFSRREPAEHLWYYRSLAEAFRTAGQAPAALIDELERVVAELESLVNERNEPQ
ncbi:HD domain-containing protein [Lamprocystis purpurea]|jgi:GTP pyrophosphokinase|uniref:HD domain-containing protein n=1 Tax=Lamprocystis purpurea TaxID=61598 RepID=UPI000362B2EC|nr:HD domain-containing protein [Lamprocystis purpurea]